MSRTLTRVGSAVMFYSVQNEQGQSNTRGFCGGVEKKNDLGSNTMHVRALSLYVVNEHGSMHVRALLLYVVNERGSMHVSSVV